MAPPLRPVPVAVAAVLALLAGAVLGVVVRPSDAGTTSQEVDPVAVPSAGGVACVSGAGPLRTDADLIVVAAPGTPPDPDVAARGLVLTLETATETGTVAGPVRTPIGPLGPGDLLLTEVPLGSDGWLWTGWADRPLLAWQEWTTPGAPGQPGGTVASACLPVDPQVQTVLGLSTADGDEAFLRLANPFDADATFAVTLVTPTEVLEPVALRNVSVRGGARTSLRLNDHVPEQRDVAAVVTVGAGRLAVEGFQRSVAAVGGVDGLASVPPVVAPAVAWTVPWSPSGPDVDGALWMLNPEPRTVLVEVTLHTSEGATVPEGAASLELGPGELRRVDITEITADEGSDVGITVRSQSSGIIVAAGARFRADDPARTGLVRMAASPVPDAEWVVAGRTAPGRRTVLHLVNRSEEEVTPSIVLTTRTGSEEGPEEGPDGEGSPEGPDVEAPPVVAPESVTTPLTAPAIAPGGVARIELPLSGEGAWSAVVAGGPGLVVSRTTLGDAPLAPVALAATPSRAWRVAGPSRSGRTLAGWVARLGTPEDLRRPDPASIGAPVIEVPVEDVD